MPLSGLQREARGEHEIAAQVAERLAVVVGAAVAALLALERQPLVVGLGDQVAGQDGGVDPRVMVVERGRLALVQVQRHFLAKRLHVVQHHRQLVHLQAVIDDDGDLVAGRVGDQVNGDGAVVVVAGNGVGAAGGGECQDKDQGG